MNQEALAAAAAALSELTEQEAAEVIAMWLAETGYNEALILERVDQLLEE